MKEAAIMAVEIAAAGLLGLIPAIWLEVRRVRRDRGQSLRPHTFE